MDFFERLDSLKQQHGDTNASFSKCSGIPYSTIDSLYKRGCGNARLNTLMAIAAHYKVSLDYLVGIGEEPDPERVKLLEIFDRLDDEGRKELLRRAEALEAKE